MSVMSPFFRELNLGRIHELRQQGLCDRTIAGIVTDQTGEKVSATEIRAYVKISYIASSKMLVSTPTLRTLKDRKNRFTDSEPDI